jgi:hypothetical protein
LRRRSQGAAIYRCAEEAAALGLADATRREPDLRTVRACELAGSDRLPLISRGGRSRAS